MTITIAIDSFKGSMSSLEAGNAAKRGIINIVPKAQVFVRPLADGGEGTVDALVEGMGGTFRTIEVTGPLGNKVKAKYGIIQSDSTAVIEMAQAAGITLVPIEERNPLNTTTFGVGELIKDAISYGCRKFIIGIGGSATNDGGLGMLQALGYECLNQKGEEVLQGAIGLKQLTEIRNTKVLPQLKECEFHIACDVSNPLLGTRGCSYVYGPQKGADFEQILQMDGWLQEYAALVSSLNKHADPYQSGAGAAGGLGFAFRSFLNARLESGIDIMIRETQLESYISKSDIVLTGEGRLDAQTVMGKAPIGVANLAKRHGKLVLGFSGAVTKETAICNQHGIDAYFPILREVVSLEEAVDKETAVENMQAAVEQVFRLLCSLENRRVNEGKNESIYI